MKLKDSSGRVIKTGDKGVINSGQSNPQEWRGDIIEKTVVTQYFKNEKDGEEILITPKIASWIKIRSV